VLDQGLAMICNELEFEELAIRYYNSFFLAFEPKP
jgi:hypothetical protein